MRPVARRADRVRIARPRRPHGRGQPAPEPEGAGAARQDGVQRVLRGLDPHPAQLRDRGQAAVGRHDELRRLVSRASTRARACATRSRRSRRWASTRSSSGTGRAACRGRSSEWTDASVVNAGDGWHAHPTQALLDCYTIRTALNRTESASTGCEIAIVGDIKHSRVARSDDRGVHDARRRRHLGRAAHAAAARRPTSRSTDRSRRRASTTLDVLYLLRMQKRADDRGARAEPARVHDPLRAHARRGPPARPSTRWSCIPAR